MKIPALSKTYGDRTVLNSPEIVLEKGKVYAVIGPNGSGKSTFAKIVAGVLAPDQKNAMQTAEEVIRYMPQKSYPFRMSMEKNILLSGGDPVEARQLMEKLNLNAVSRQKISSLSGGETAKIALVRVLMKPSDLLILDEPTAAMDMESAIAAENMILDYRKTCGCTVLMVTHDLQQARRLADEVLFFYEGELYEQGPAARILYDPEKEITRRFLEFYGIS